MEALEQLLKNKGARLGKNKGANGEIVAARASTTRFLANHYPTFDEIRAALTDKSKNHNAGYVIPKSDAQERLLNNLTQRRLTLYDAKLGYCVNHNNDAKLFLSGAWLEELAYHAVKEAGADAVLHRQMLDWKVGQYKGHNEIDVLARFNDKLLFVECKCATAYLDDTLSRGEKKRERDNLSNRLLGFLHKADDLVDHFGDIERDEVMLIVTTDMIDELHGYRTRFPTLFGKAKALDVELVGFDDLVWRNLVARITNIMNA